VVTGLQGAALGAWLLTLVVAGLTTAVSAAAAAPTPSAALRDFGFDWVTIGHVGNRSITLDEGFDEQFFRDLGGEKISTPVVGRGSVNHEYRLTKTVVTVGQWFEFVQAFTPYAQDVLNAGTQEFFTNLTGRSITIKNFPVPPGVDPVYEIVPGANPNAAAIDMSWRFAARYVNWLNNGKAITRDAFSNGAYDEATFDPNTRIGEQPVHNVDAQFWIPTLDEMLKGGYYDPNRYGPGIEGYWRQPDGGNEPLVSGRPGEPGAETSGGLFNDPLGTIGIIPVGAYPDVLSPLGLLDVSGGGSKTEELVTILNITAHRIGIGSGPGSPVWEITDALGSTGGDIGGLRIASVVPAPGGAGLLMLLGCCAGVRRQSRTSRNT